MRLEAELEIPILFLVIFRGRHFEKGLEGVDFIVKIIISRKDPTKQMGFAMFKVVLDVLK